jgi:hypothetical protein
VADALAIAVTGDLDVLRYQVYIRAAARSGMVVVLEPEKELRDRMPPRTHCYRQESAQRTIGSAVFLHLPSQPPKPSEGEPGAAVKSSVHCSPVALMKKPL